MIFLVYMYALLVYPSILVQLYIVIYQFARTLICSILHVHIRGIIYLFANIPIQLWIVMYFFNAFNILTYSYPCRFIFKFS